ncbi:MAG: acyltransferase [Bacteroidales bacterium]|jgi:phenylacetate-coenzyme A ligase PaaK-like adenylate-forming protein|nr:acyltransferase [Bacteroidales bacterium]
MRNKELESQIFSVHGADEFNRLSIAVFHFQYVHNPVYRQFVDALAVNPALVERYEQIPFLPISLFKSHEVRCHAQEPELLFESSKTTGMTSSRHYVEVAELYNTSFSRCFEQFYGSASNYVFLALLPNYLEQQHSSLVYMASELIAQSGSGESGFFLHNFADLDAAIRRNAGRKKIFLIGVSYALLDFAEQYSYNNIDMIVMETGGMKGRRKELLRSEMHEMLRKSFGVAHIHSEYGMAELLSQAYSQQDGMFRTPAWAKILVRDVYDPFSYMPAGKSGGINVIDLANLYSCSFIETKDVGRLYENGNFSVEGRFDSAEIRGCNLMY